MPQEIGWGGVRFMVIWFVVGLVGWFLSDKIKDVYYKITKF